ncbi:hypothetical protein RBH29_01270 [Herbivorax sp. ANBcel31]|nr:hypothetical protein [Herbivorax sp. ANBcel31]MDQ2085068.1 hypothetical protein [Herbivorax sp. ANBcel31]
MKANSANYNFSKRYVVPFSIMNLKYGTVMPRKNALNSYFFIYRFN